MTKNLIERNRHREERMVQHGVGGGGVDQGSALDASADPSQQDLLHLPFILINAPRDCKINCEMLEDR